MIEKHITIEIQKDIALSVYFAKQVAESLGFSSIKTSELTIVVSELASNIFFHAKGEGIIIIREIRKDSAVGIEIKAEDQGQGIEDIELAMTDGYSTKKNSMGKGLSGSKRMVDEFFIASELGKGTQVKIIKWKR